MTLIRRVVRRLARIFKKDYRLSYSQTGEDVILDSFFQYLQIPKPTYLDIGAHHPTYLSNTYAFYRKGSRGVCVEPDPALFAKIARRRKGDVCLNVGVGITGESKGNFYVMSVPSMNTFSEEEARGFERDGYFRIEKVIELPLVSVNAIIEKHFSSQAPDFISIDVEGLDLEILQSFDFSRYRPKAFCVETIEYAETLICDENGPTLKVHDVAEFMKSQGYYVFADTYINTIFVDGILVSDKDKGQ